MEQIIPPGYKMTEVGVIPEDWHAHKLSEIGEFKNGVNKDASAFGHGLPFVNLNDVFTASAISDVAHLGLIDSTDIDRRQYSLSAGDVLFIRSSVKPSGVGLTAVITAPLRDTIYSGFLIRFRDNGFLDKGFKKFCFSGSRFRKKIIAASSVSANTNINQNALAKIYIALPPKTAEQEAIAEALSDADALIESLDQLIAKKRQIKQAAMQELLTGNKRLPGFDSKWNFRSFQEIAMPRRLRVSDDNSETQPFFCVELEDIGQATGKLTSNTLYKSSISMKTRFKRGDVLFGKLRAYLRKYWMADCDGVCSTEIWALSAIENHSVSAYIRQIVETSGFIEVASNAYGTHMPRSDWKLVGNYQLLVPDIEEQTAIAAILTDLDDELAALDAKRDKAKAIKAGMMQQLLTGKIRLI